MIRPDKEGKIQRQDKEAPIALGEHRGIGEQDLKETIPASLLFLAVWPAEHNGSL